MLHQIKKNAFCLEILKKTINIDQAYFFYLLCNSDLAFLKKRAKSERSFFLIIKGAISFIGGFLKSFLNFPLMNKYNLKNYSFLGYWDSENNKQVIIPVLRHLSNSVDISFNSQSKYRLSNLISYLFAFPFLLLLLYRLFTIKNKNLKYVYKQRFALVWKTYGIFIYFFKILSNKKQILLIPNDHEYKARILRKVAKDVGIVTVFIQHASVSPYFPALDFEYAFLDGNDAIEKYSKISSSKTIVFLTGNPKYDSWYKHKNQACNVSSIGICTNTIDSLSKAKNVIEFIKKNYPMIKLSLRPHPGDKRKNEWELLCESFNIKCCRSQNETVIDFLKSTDAIIAAESNIHLEAAIINVFPIYFNLQENTIYNDVYGFVQKGLVFNTKESFEELGLIVDKIIHNKPTTNTAVKQFLATTDSVYEGKSAELISKLINEIFTKNIDFKIWTRCAEIKNIVTYKLKDG